MRLIRKEARFRLRSSARVVLRCDSYEYVPRDDGGYFHRRAVNWLWNDRSGVPVEEIYAKRFSMRTLYMLTPSDLNMSALQRYITSQEPGGSPEPFVLIIDEINRANISKVFGELITLLEPDKRTTPDGGGLKVRLNARWHRQHASACRCMSSSG